MESSEKNTILDAGKLLQVSAVLLFTLIKASICHPLTVKYNKGNISFHRR